MLSGWNSAKLSAQSPPCNKKAFPSTTSASCCFKCLVSPAKTSGGKVLLISNETADIISENVRFTLDIPKADEFLTPFLMTIPLQKLAYYSALKKGYDIDKPRNLAKSVTVE